MGSTQRSILPTQEATMSEISFCQLDSSGRKSPIRTAVNHRVALRTDCAAGGWR